MFLKLILFTLLLSVSAISTADPIIHCPTASEIKGNQFADWLPLYKDGEELASHEDVENFKAHIIDFSFTNWNPYYLEAAHCYYRGDDPIADRIIFAHDAFRPIENINWHWLSNKTATCNTSEDVCGFRL